jgi:hypothetical protein
MAFPRTFSALTGAIPTTYLDENFDAIEAKTSASVGAGLPAYDPELPYAADRAGGVLSRLGALINANTGLATDGTVNVGGDIQDIIDANKGRRIFLVGPATYLVSGMSLSGTSYDGTIIEAIGNVEFKLAPDGGNSNFGGAWIGLLIKDCAGVELRNLLWHGNRANMTAREQIGCVGIAGAADYKIIGGRIREIRGDGIWIGQSDWLSNSTVPVRGRISGVRGYNSAVDGRNFITVISADDLEIDGVDSRQIGGVIGVTTMPGGICVEPDQTYHTINDLRIRDSFIESAGTSGVAILGKSLTGVDASEDWNATNCSVKNTTVRLISGAAAGPAFTRISGLDLDLEVIQKSGTRRKLVVIDGAKRVYGRTVTRGGSVNVSVGEALRVRDFGLEVQAYDYETAGLLACDVDYGVFTGSIYGASSNVYSFAIQLADAGRTVTQTGVTYSVDCRADGNNLRAVRRESGGGTLTLTNTRIANCDFSGYASIATTIDAALPAHNVVGLTGAAPEASFANADATPSVGIPAKFWACANAGSTSITMFDDGYDGQEIVVRLDSNTTVVHNSSNIRLQGAANITGRTSDDFVEFRRISGIWFEQRRSW